MTSRPSADRPPRVSVSLPVYNSERWLAEAVESILNQSFRDFEFLAHNDGGIDGSLAMLRDYAARDDRLVVTTGPNQGVAAARNFMLSKARGEYIAVMDADDICHPDRFARQIAYLDAHREIVVLGGGETTIDEKGRSIRDFRFPPLHEEIDGNNLRGLTSIRHPSVMMRKGALVRCGGYDPSYDGAEDQELWLRMAEVGCLANLPDIILKYRIHEKSISGAKRDLQRRMCRQACETAWARRGLTGMSFDYADWRMEDTPESRRKFYLSYGWQAWNNGYRDTWRYYALRSVGLAPFSRAAWTLLIAGALKRPEISKPPQI